MFIIENVRQTLKSLNEEEYENFLKLLKEYFIKNNSSLKPSQLSKQLTNFIDNKQHVNLKYFEGYVTVLNIMFENGGLRALGNSDIKNTNITWRELLISITEDITVPQSVQKLLQDELTAKDLKVLFMNVINYCSDPNHQNFKTNIHDCNRFFSIKTKSKKDS